MARSSRAVVSAASLVGGKEVRRDKYCIQGPVTTCTLYNSSLSGLEHILFYFLLRMVRSKGSMCVPNEYKLHSAYGSETQYVYIAHRS
jgi:hypothetical protein